MDDHQKARLFLILLLIHRVAHAQHMQQNEKKKRIKIIGIQWARIGQFT